MEIRSSILIVDDDPTILELHTAVLRKVGYEVMTARTGDECLEMVRLYHPDLVILDVMLPDGLGTDLCAQIKSDPDLKNTLILLTSGIRTASRYQAAGLNCGADGYMAKPISNIEFLARIQSMERIKLSKEVLKKAHDELERRVEERTAELSEANRLLNREIAEHQVAARALKKSEQRLRYLTDRLQKILEQERVLLSREIHDELGQILTVIKMDAAWIETSLPSDNTQLLERMNLLATYIDSAMGAVQRISMALRPPPLDDLGLTRAIKAQAADFERRTGIVCEVKGGTHDIEPERAISTEVYRIFQESLTNVARHARAHMVTVSLDVEEEKYIMKVNDDGRGITKKEIAHVKSIGLTGMRERADSIGGSFRIEGAAGKGTTVTLIVPLCKNRQRGRGKRVYAGSQLAGG